MFGLTPLGVVHTAISIVAVVAGIAAIVRHRKIGWATRSGRWYIVATLLTCLTGFGIFQRGGFGPPHVLGVLTLIVLAIAFVAERRSSGSHLARYVAALGYSTTLFFHVIPGFTETSSRLPPGAPLTTGPEDPRLQFAIGTAFLVFLVAIARQAYGIRTELQRTP